MKNTNLILILLLSSTASSFAMDTPQDSVVETFPITYSEEKLPNQAWWVSIPQNDPQKAFTGSGPMERPSHKGQVASWDLETLKTTQIVENGATNWGGSTTNDMLVVGSGHDLVFYGPNNLEEIHRIEGVATGQMGNIIPIDMRGHLVACGTMDGQNQNTIGTVKVFDTRNYKKITSHEFEPHTFVEFVKFISDEKAIVVPAYGPLYVYNINTKEMQSVSGETKKEEFWQLAFEVDGDNIYFSLPSNGSVYRGSLSHDDGSYGLKEIVELFQSDNLKVKLSDKQKQSLTPLSLNKYKDFVIACGWTVGKKSGVLDIYNTKMKQNITQKLRAHGNQLGISKLGQVVMALNDKSLASVSLNPELQSFQILQKKKIVNQNNESDGCLLQ